MPLRPKDPQLQRATRLRTELRRSLAEVELLLRKADELLHFNRRRRSGSGAEKKLFRHWNSHLGEDES